MYQHNASVYCNYLAKNNLQKVNSTTAMVLYMCRTQTCKISIRKKVLTLILYTSILDVVLNVGLEGQTMEQNSNKINLMGWLTLLLNT